MQQLLQLLCLAVCALAIAPGAAQAERPLATGFADPYFASADPGVRGSAFDQAVRARGELVRINVLWRSVATAQPASPSDPGDPAYDWRPYDTAIRDAVAHGLEPLLTIYRAPVWAEGPGRPAGTPAGSWRPRPEAIADFARATASRYSGSFSDAGGTLPRVRLFQLWNEPNLTTYLSPQYEGTTPQAPGIYRDMLNAFYPAVKQVHADNLVITAGTAPYGDPPGEGRTRPLSFWRDVLCVSASQQPLACPSKPSFDVLAHHPINTSGGPRKSAVDPDDISTPDLGALRKVLRAAERGNNVATGGRHELWVTELWWESNPPDTVEGVPPTRQARWLEQAYYLLWKAGASAVINLQVRDAPFDRANPFGDTATGVFFADGTAKPSATAVRFPFVVERRSKHKLVAWGKAPASGRLKVQRERGSSWRLVKKLRVNAGEVFKTKLRLERGHKRLRATVGGERSLVWRKG